MKMILLLMKTNAIVLLAAGVAFSLYAPLMMAFFAIPELLQISSDTYWQIAAFARMYGAALFGLGLLVWSANNSFHELPIASQKRTIAALILAHLMGAFIAFTEQSSIWWTQAGWVLTGMYVIFLTGYIWAIVKLPRNTSLDSQPETEQSNQ